MRVIYSDESGLGSIQDEPVTVVTAIMLNMESQWEPVERDLFTIQNLIPPRLLKHGYELHGKKLFNGVRRKDLDAEKSLPLILRVPDVHCVPIFYGAVDRAGFAALPDAETKVRNQRQSAYDMAFHSCVRRVETYVRTTLPKTERVLWIAEHSGYEKNLKFTLGWAQATENITIEDESIEIVRKTPTRFVDTVYFGDSGDSLALQLADVCCCAITHFLLERYYGCQPQIVEPYYRILQGQIVNDGTAPLFKDS